MQQDCSALYRDNGTDQASDPMSSVVMLSYCAPQIRMPDPFKDLSQRRRHTDFTTLHELGSWCVGNIGLDGKSGHLKTFA